MGILDPVKSKAYRDGLIQHAKDVDAVLAEVSEPTRQFMRKAYQLSLYPLEFARETAAKLEAFRLAARAEGAREAQIECPACGEAVKQIASATLSLALWQHWNWVCRDRAQTRHSTPIGRTGR